MVASIHTAQACCIHTSTVFSSAAAAAAPYSCRCAVAQFLLSVCSPSVWSFAFLLRFVEACLSSHSFARSLSRSDANTSNGRTFNGSLVYTLYTSHCVFVYETYTLTARQTSLYCSCLSTRIKKRTLLLLLLLLFLLNRCSVFRFEHTHAHTDSVLVLLLVSRLLSRFFSRSPVLSPFLGVSLSCYAVALALLCAVCY